MKTFLKNHKRLVPALITLSVYIFLGLFIYFSVREDKSVKVREKEQRVPDDSAETHPAKTHLVVNDGYGQIEYYARLDDSYSFMGLLDYHKKKSGLTFSKTLYSFGTSLDDINGHTAPNGYGWRVYNNGEDITHNLSGLKLENEHVYLIKLEPQK